MYLAEEEWGKNTFAASELYQNEDGTYGIRYIEMDFPKSAEEADFQPLWHTRMEGKWYINENGYLVLENLGFLKPANNFGKPEVVFAYTKAVAAEGVVGQTTQTKMIDSIIGQFQEVIYI